MTTADRPTQDDFTRAAQAGVLPGRISEMREDSTLDEVNAEITAALEARALAHGQQVDARDAADQAEADDSAADIAPAPSKIRIKATSGDTARRVATKLLDSSVKLNRKQQITAELAALPEGATPAMQLAVKQRWNVKALLTLTVKQLEAQLAAVTVAATPTATEIAGLERNGKAMSDSDAAPIRERATAEAARLLANAKVNAWRERGKLQAALDTRKLAYATRFAGKSK